MAQDFDNLYNRGGEARQAAFFQSVELDLKSLWVITSSLSSGPFRMEPSAVTTPTN